ncbi:uncharacterized protein LOC143274778 [Babylonia areolata]|uniref:uncharacterized protein LOC143274778 n=1 Tax=Babylonia areolata TaxID=304850 RepID=UPI003FD31FCD
MSDRPSPGLCERGSKTSSTPVGKNGDSTAARSPTESVAAMPRKDKVRGWGRKDVSRWLEKRSLVKFVPLFLRNGIVGADLVESRLSFLYEEGVGVSDREQLLAEIYMLLHPDSPRLVRRSPPSSSSLSLSAVHPRDREKYQAALQVAKSPPSQNSSSPVVLIGSRNRSPAAVTLTVTPTSTSTLTSATTLSVPTSKPRSRSESGLETEGSAAMTSPSPGRKYLKRKSTPAVHDYLQRGTTAAQNASLFETLEAEGRVCLQCVRVHRSEAAGSKFGFSYQTLPDSCLLVTNLKPSPTLPLQIGDRILEVNGILLPGHKGSTIETVLSKSASLDVVVVRHMSSVEQDNKTEPNHYDKLQQELVMGEVRWQSLRQLLTSLQHKSFDPLTLTGTLSRVEDMEDMKKRATLEMEVEELQRTCAELTGRMNSLQGQSDSQGAGTVTGEEG